MNITYRVALEIITHEAIVRQTYRDSVGVNTWSVGLTNATGHDVTRYINNPQPMEKCLRIFVWALDNYADAVREAFEGYELTETEFAAALSFHWNTGAIKTASWVKAFKAGNELDARAKFMRYRKPPEIIPRREKERDLLFDGVWSQTGRVTEYTRLKANRTPNFSSGKRVDIEDALKAALANHNAPVTTPEPVPGKPEENTLMKSIMNLLGAGGLSGLLTSCGKDGNLSGDMTSLGSTEGLVGIVILIMLLTGNSEAIKGLFTGKPASGEAAENR